MRICGIWQMVQPLNLVDLVQELLFELGTQPGISYSTIIKSNCSRRLMILYIISWIGDS